MSITCSRFKLPQASCCWRFNRQLGLWLIILLPLISFGINNFSNTINLATFNNNWQQWLRLGLIAPLLEESVFRGLFQEWLTVKLSHNGLTLVGVLLILNLIFSILHYQHLSQMLYLLAIFGCSCIFSWVKHITHSTWATIGIHSYYNLCFLSYCYYFINYPH